MQHRKIQLLINLTYSLSLTPAHRLPSEQSIYRHKWLKAMQLDHVAKWKTICSVHFKVTDYLRGHKLKVDAVPSQQMPTPTTETIFEHRFRMHCRYCLRPTNDDDGLQIDWDEWPYSEFSSIFEDITNLKVFFFLTTCINTIL